MSDVEGRDKPARPPALQVKNVAGWYESHNYPGSDWRAGGLAGRRYECFDVIDVERRGKPAGPPALQAAGAPHRGHSRSIALGDSGHFRN